MTPRHIVAGLVGLFGLGAVATAAARTTRPDDASPSAADPPQFGIDPRANESAFLDLIAYAEGTAKQPDPYRVTFGYGYLVRSLADHPAITGEWTGKRLTDRQCAGAGFGPGCVSTAAGKYQIIKPTWLRAKRALMLPDFGPESQDRAALWLVQQDGALGDVHAGLVASAIDKCRLTWASLPGAGYDGQGERALPELLAVFEAGGGRTA